MFSVCSLFLLSFLDYQLPRHPGGNRRTTNTNNGSSFGKNETYCGVVIQLRDSFGFLQPLLPPPSHLSLSQPVQNTGSAPEPEFMALPHLSFLNEQLYFHEREAFSGIRVGMEVFFRLRQTPKGVQASSLHAVPLKDKTIYKGMFLFLLLSLLIVFLVLTFIFGIRSVFSIFKSNIFSPPPPPPPLLLLLLFFFFVFFFL